MLHKDAKTAIAATARAAGIPPDRIVAGLAAMEGAPAKAGAGVVAVQQARVCEMLSCSRHHVRKLERLGLLIPVELAGVRRYAVADILRLLTTPKDRHEAGVSR